MKKHLTKKEIKIPIYTGTLLLIDSNSKKKVKKEVKNFDKHEIYATSVLFEHKSKTGYGIVFNFDYKHAKISHGVIAHEAYHISSFIAEEHRIQWDPANDEPFAYLINWIVDQIYLFTKENNLKVHLEKY
tara:strand:- start:1908 stop:2297 length:390 start_codon:yes stop_codon:yes gene_type:complete